MSISPSSSPQKKKRQNSSRLRNKHKSKAKSKSPQPEMVKKDYVKSEYLEPVQMTKGHTIQELYQKIAEWTGIHIENLQIARILCTGRKYAKNPVIENLKEKDQTMKLKRIPINHKDDILVWDANQGNLAESGMLWSQRKTN